VGGWGGWLRVPLALRLSKHTSHTRRALARNSQTQKVKLLKAVINGIVVDVSFNQLGGMLTLNALEELDVAIGEDHLLKRAIILVGWPWLGCGWSGWVLTLVVGTSTSFNAGRCHTPRQHQPHHPSIPETCTRTRTQVKAWCYYESRVLGAVHGLISTYALETLVLYLFNKHHAVRPFTTPLQLLHAFLTEFGAFDWDRYCLTLRGPARLDAFNQQRPRGRRPWFGWHPCYCHLSHSCMHACIHLRMHACHSISP